MIYTGDCRDILPTLPEQSVQCVVTSPPYWRLRDYGADGQIGLEPTPEEYLETMVEVFRQVWRVLRDDGTVWCNMGDSFQDKQLLGMPWRLALALQADGWYLRSDIIWAKGLSFCPSYAGSVMPESCTDRPTKAHEYLFLLTKSPRYFYDAEAVRETHVTEPGRHPVSKPGAHLAMSGAKAGNVGNQAGYHPSGRNLRTVWAINPKPYSEAHFATFPPALVEPCVKAGTSEKGCCAACGAPWVRVVERADPPKVGGSDLDRYGYGSFGVHRKVGGQYQKWLDANPKRTTSWQATCAHDPVFEGENVPCMVLDPFAGSGTTGIVARKLSRSFVGIELNPKYVALAEKRDDGQRYFNWCEAD